MAYFVSIRGDCEKTNENLVGSIKSLMTITDKSYRLLTVPGDKRLDISTVAGMIANELRIEDVVEEQLLYAPDGVVPTLAVVDQMNEFWQKYFTDAPVNPDNPNKPMAPDMPGTIIVANLPVAIEAARTINWMRNSKGPLHLLLEPGQGVYFEIGYKVKDWLFGDDRVAAERRDQINGKKPDIDHWTYL